MGDLSKNFSRHEFICKDHCGFDTVDAELITRLQELRDHFGQEITVLSGCRCIVYNQKVSGSFGSQHLYGRAADFIVKDVDPREVQRLLYRWFPNNYGIGSYPTFTHLDTRTIGPTRW